MNHVETSLEDRDARAARYSAKCVRRRRNKVIETMTFMVWGFNLGVNLYRISKSR